MFQEDMWSMKEQNVMKKGKRKNKKIRKHVQKVKVWLKNFKESIRNLKAKAEEIFHIMEWERNRERDQKHTEKSNLRSQTLN